MQRYQIAALIKAGHTNGFIANQLGVHRSTIARELRRNGSSKNKYSPALAQQFADDRKADKEHFVAFNEQMKTFVNHKLKNQQ